MIFVNQDFYIFFILLILTKKETPKLERTTNKKTERPIGPLGKID